MSDAGRGGEWLKYGCFGCLGLIVLFAVIAIGVVGFTSMQVRGEQVERPQITHAATSPTALGGPPALGRVTLRASNGGFEIRPGEAGEPLRLEAEYDATSYRLTEQLSEDATGWHYEITFESTGSGLIGLLKQIMGGTSPSFTMYLPPDTPLDLDFEIYRAGGMIELGGLWLRNARLSTKQGGFQFEISEPLREPMESLTIEASMGGLEANDLGNASPRVLDVRSSMGGLDLDLDGAWRNDSAVSLDVSRGGVQLKIPRDVIALGLSGVDSVPALDDTETPTPTLRFTTAIAESGEVTVNGRPLTP